MYFSESQKQIILRIKKIKEQSGSHSPSMRTIIDEFPSLNIKVDACFLSNPYATDLFIEFFNKDIINRNKFRDLTEFYPSQNRIISKSIASRLNCDVKYLFVTNGAIEGIQAVIHNFSGKKIFINLPTFSSYYEFAEHKYKVIYNNLKKENNFVLDIENYYKQVIKYNPDTVVLINPNNPDGSYIRKDQLKWLLNKLRSVETVIIDESFIHFAYETDSEEIPSAMEYLNKMNNLVIIKSMSKDFGIAGLRVGYVAMHPDRINHLLSRGFLWNISGLGEYFFKLYSKDKFWNKYNIIRKKYIEETKQFYSNLKQIEWLKVYPTKANFVLIELVKDITAEMFTFKLLLEFGIYVRNCDDKIGLEGEFIRMASRKNLQNKYIINSINELGKQL